MIPKLTIDEMQNLSDKDFLLFVIGFKNLIPEELLDLNQEDWKFYCAVSKRAVENCLNLMEEYRKNKKAKE